MAVPAEILQAQYLPPREARLIDARTEKVDTPVDDRGLVDTSALISAVKETIEPGYLWPHNNNNEHHFYWPGEEYKNRLGSVTSVMKRFRELPISKGYMPKEFHNWLHAVTIPPPIPAIEVMEQRIDAWGIARKLFHSARIETEKKLSVPHKHLKLSIDNGVSFEVIDYEIMAETLFDILTDREDDLERIDHFIPEFNLIEAISNDPHKVTKIMGKIVCRKNLWLVPDVVAA